MFKPLQLFRLMKINWILLTYGLTTEVVGQQNIWLRGLVYLNPLHYLPGRKKRSRGEAIRLMLEKLGPIFVKFGQVLSTRRDLLPAEIINELEKLQDQVPSFDGQVARALIEEALGESVTTLFAQFDTTPLASASIAQVHSATLPQGDQVIVKVLRPGILSIIKQDISLLYTVARLTERFWSHGKRLRPVALVHEFEQTILDELDLLREAANASQLRRNFKGSQELYVPKVYWSLTRQSVMVMERIFGIRISDTATLQAHGTDMKVLAENGVNIFFTQVFRDCFFHADMHPGNLFVDVSQPKTPKYIGIDFGIMGTLNPTDQRYLAENLLAFFTRDYRRVALLHIESGWVPPDTRVDSFESAIRTVCEPVFERPLSEISFGQLLLRLFQTAARFNMEVQPQLMLLQKTLLNIEGLGRQLYPQLDLWQTAKPFLEKWMREQRSVKKITKEIITDWPRLARHLLKTPDLVYYVLNHKKIQQTRSDHPSEKKRIRQRHQVRRSFCYGISVSIIGFGLYQWITHPTAIRAHTPVVGSLLVGAVIVGLAQLLFPKKN